MPAEPDLIVVTLLVGPGVEGRPVTEDVGAFQRLVIEKLGGASGDGIGLNLVFDLAGVGVIPPFTGPKLVRFDKRRQRFTIAIPVPSDLSARMTTEFIRDQTSEALLLAEQYLRSKKLSGQIKDVGELLHRAVDALPRRPLSEDERYREIVHGNPSVNRPVRSIVELDAGGRELRKVDVYSDGAMDYAVRLIETGTTRLNRPVAGPTGASRLITFTEFTSVWERAIAQERPRGPIIVRETGLEDTP